MTVSNSGEQIYSCRCRCCCRCCFDYVDGGDKIWMTRTGRKDDEVQQGDDDGSDRCRKFVVVNSPSQSITSPTCSSSYCSSNYFSPLSSPVIASHPHHLHNQQSPLNAHRQRHRCSLMQSSAVHNTVPHRRRKGVAGCRYARHLTMATKLFMIFLCVLCCCFIGSCDASAATAGNGKVKSPQAGLPSSSSSSNARNINNNNNNNKVNNNNNNNSSRSAADVQPRGGVPIKSSLAYSSSYDDKLSANSKRYGGDEDEVSAEHSLYQMLLGGERYQKHVRPVRNHKKPITVRVGMCVMMIEELLERDQIMVMAACVKMVWVDEFLTWNPANYDNLTWLAISSTSLWLPDIAIINSPEPYSLTRKATNVDLNYKGEIGYFPSGRLATRCNLQITYFPFDWQHCEVRFESWIYPSQFLEIELYPGAAVDLKEYYVNHQWTVTGYRILSEKADYDGKNFSSITFTFTLRRKSSFYFMYFIFPELLLALLQTLSHTLPCEHPGRMTMLTALFIGTSVTHAGIASHIPKSSDTMSLLQIYMAIMSINLVFALIVTFVMLYTVLRYPNEEPCATAMLSAFFSIVWPSRRPPGARRKSIIPPGNVPRYSIAAASSCDSSSIKKDSSQHEMKPTRRRQQQQQQQQQQKMPSSDHPPAPSSIYEAIIASQQSSKTADKLAYSDVSGDPQQQQQLRHGTLPRDLSDLALIRSSAHSSRANLNEIAGGATALPGVRIPSIYSTQPQLMPPAKGRQSATTKHGSGSSRMKASMSDENFQLVASQTASGVVYTNLVRPGSQQRLSNVDDRDDVTNSIVYNMSFTGDPADNGYGGNDGASTPGARSLSIGGAASYYVPTAHCIDAVSTPQISPRSSIRSRPSQHQPTSAPHRRGRGGGGDDDDDDDATNNADHGPTRPLGVAFRLDEDQEQALIRRRGAEAATSSGDGEGGDSSGGGGGGGGKRMPSKREGRGGGSSGKSGSDDQDLKRRWLLYCVALDKSIMYANGIWNVTLPIALFWIVPALHEAMLSPQIDR